MSSDFDDGLTDELAEQIGREIELEPKDETRAVAAVRPGDGEGSVELVLSDEDGEEPDVTVALTRDAALALAAALGALADHDPPSAG